MAASWRSRTTPPLVCAVVDGTSVWAVSTSSGTVENRVHATGATTKEALGKALSSFRPKDPVRLLLCSPQQTCESHETVAADAERVACAPAGRSTPYGYTFSGQANSPGPVVACYAPASALEDGVAGREVTWAPGPLVAGAVGEAVVYIGSSSSWMATYTHGKAVRARTLTTPGMDGLLASLGAEGARRRVAAALSGSGTDPLASGEVGRWANTLAAEVANCAGAWRGEGVVVPAGLTLIGPGAGFSRVHEALTAKGVNVHPVQDSEYRLAVAGAEFAPWTEPVLFHTAPANTKPRSTVRRFVAGVAAVAVAPSLVVTGYAAGAEAWSNRNLDSVASSVANSVDGEATLTASLATQVAVSIPSVPGDALNELLEYTVEGGNVVDVQVNNSVMTATVSIDEDQVVQYTTKLPPSWKVTQVRIDNGVATVDVQASPVSSMGRPTWQS